MTNKLYDSKGQLIGYIRTVEKNQHDDLMKVILSTGHELVFGPCDLTSDRDGNWRIRSGALYLLGVRVRRRILLRTQLLSRTLSLLLRPRSFTGRMVPRPL